ncbi:MAG: 3-methyl-2-oxobutanoate hydroxymethyltransferase [Spirochaetales bacterium]|nr:3-methyl-2-oxobutanoate hydroxymethyltransferase [Spirochaetales bacterium]
MSLKKLCTALKGKKKLVMLTAYDAQIARILSGTDLDLILVGDTLGVVFQGYKTTHGVTMADMLYHTKAVVRGAGLKPVIGDMPINSYTTEREAVRNAGLFLEAGAKAVKIEGNKPHIIKALNHEGIEVMGHVGLLPQTAQRYRVQGKTDDDAKRILYDALELAKSDIFALVLECIPESLAKKITESVTIPTIGIGAGPYCDGQVLVINDMLGMDEEYMPKFVKHYAELTQTISSAARQFIEDVRMGKFPDSSHTYH